jgi:hypothetical protein
MVYAEALHGVRVTMCTRACSINYFPCACYTPVPCKVPTAAHTLYTKGGDNTYRNVCYVYKGTSRFHKGHTKF